MTNKKVLMFGLGNCGKSSILKAIRGESPLLEPFPTKNSAVVEIPEQQTVIFELGGTGSYPKMHLKHLDLYLPDTDEIIFVVDVQQPERHEEAVLYFTGIIDGLKISAIKPKISIYLHKYDQNMPKSIDLTTLERELNEKVIKPIKAVVSKDFELEFYKTSIRCTFERKRLGA